MWITLKKNYHILQIFNNITIVILMPNTLDYNWIVYIEILFFIVTLLQCTNISSKLKIKITKKIQIWGSNR